MAKGPEGPKSESYYTLEQAKNALIEDWENLQEHDKEQAAKDYPDMKGKSYEEMDDLMFGIDEAENVVRMPFEERVVDTWRDHVSPQQKPELLSQFLSEGRIDFLRFLNKHGCFQDVDETIRQTLKDKLQVR